MGLAMALPTARLFLFHLTPSLSRNDLGRSGFSLVGEWLGNYEKSQPALFSQCED